MSLLIGFLTVILVLDCCFLVFLVLLQLPKKDAGAGMAFGGATTDALFGAGSGNVMTQITKWSAGIFFVLCLGLTVLAAHQARRSGAKDLTDALSQQGAAPLEKLPPSKAAGLVDTTPGGSAPASVPVPATNASGLLEMPSPTTPPGSAPAPAPSTAPAQQPPLELPGALPVTPSGGTNK